MEISTNKCMYMTEIKNDERHWTEKEKDLNPGSSTSY